MRFWDSSAILPLLVVEPSSAEAERELREDADVVVWWGTPVECLSALARLERDGTFSAGQADQSRTVLAELAEHWHEVLPTTALREQAGRLLRRHPLRASDALQLAAALVWTDGRPEGHSFCVLDARLAAAARAEGFAIRLNA